MLQFHLKGTAAMQTDFVIPEADSMDAETGSVGVRLEEVTGDYECLPAESAAEFFA